MADCSASRSAGAAGESFAEASRCSAACQSRSNRFRRAKRAADTGTGRDCGRGRLPGRSPLDHLARREPGILNPPGPAKLAFSVSRSALYRVTTSRNSLPGPASSGLRSCGTAASWAPMVATLAERAQRDRGNGNTAKMHAVCSLEEP